MERTATKAGMNVTGKTRAEAQGKIEQRLYLANSELRIANDDGSNTLTIEGCAYRGSATITDQLGKFTERFAVGAAKALIDRGGIATDGRDVFLNVGHSQEVIPLARTSSKTLRLFEQNGELRFKADLDLRQTTASDVAVAIENGNLGNGGVSVGMLVLSDSWNASQTERTIHAVDLREISLVPHGAYMGTSVELAQRGIYVAELESNSRSRSTTGRKTSIDDLRREFNEMKRDRERKASREAIKSSIARLVRETSEPDRAAAAFHDRVERDRKETIASLERSIATARNWGQFHKVVAFQRELEKLTNA